MRVKVHGKPVADVPPRLLFQAWRPDGTDAVRHAFLDGDVPGFKPGSEYSFRVKLGTVEGEEVK